VAVMDWAYPADWIAFAAARLAGVPYLIHSDTDVRDPGYSPALLRRPVLRWLCRNAAGALYTGTFNRDFYIRNGTPPERLWFSPWAVEIDLFREGDRAVAREELGLRDDVCYLLFVGTLIPRKRPELLLRVLARLQREGHRVGVLFAGTGQLEDELRRTTERERLGDVHFLGFVNQSRLPTVYAAGDVLVLPSIRDPRATVVNEAMAAGLPVVISSGTGVWGPGDLVRDGREGIVFEVDDTNALVDACRRVLDPAVRRSMGEAAARQVERWSYEIAVEGWVEAVTSIAARNGSARAGGGPP
jgi:glycosyltransferase involved in cell wall biosynthesis